MNIKTMMFYVFVGLAGGSYALINTIQNKPDVLFATIPLYLILCGLVVALIKSVTDRLEIQK